MTPKENDDVLIIDNRKRDALFGKIVGASKWVSTVVIEAHDKETGIDYTIMTEAGKLHYEPKKDWTPAERWIYVGPTEH